MRKILHLSFGDKTDPAIVRPVFLKVLPRRDTGIADPLRRIDVWRNEGGAGRPKPL